ncbi:glycosyltransferase [Candidatus Amesbacteria bacterium]|nr:glycosyltransferase [Candidatus Amesbacteria bacterium]
MRISAHMVVKNEDKWIWYSLMSVLDYVDEIMVWDTGSIDKTVEIIKSIDNPKIKFRQRLVSNAQDLTSARQVMLSATKADWLMILDGDEIWPEKALVESISKLDNSLNFLVNKFWNLAGDVYHYQPDNAGKYRIGKHTGHLTIRFINLNKYKNLKYMSDYPLEGLTNNNKTLIQNDINSNYNFVTAPYLHATHLERSNLAWNSNTHRNIQKIELGDKIPDNFEYPKCLYIPGPNNPWEKRSWSFVLNAMWQTPLREIKRNLG